MRPPTAACAQTSHVGLDELAHSYDSNGTPVASESVADAIAFGWVVTRPRRDVSPNGLAWPGVDPKPWRHR